MTSLLALLADDKFTKDVASKPYSTAEQDKVKCCLSLVEKILDLEGDQGQSKWLSLLFEEISGSYSPTINELYCQISCEARHANDASKIMASVLGKLSSFSWDFKAVLTLSAFSVYCAEHRHLADNEESDYKLQLAAVLRGPRAGKLPSGALEDLMRVTLAFTKCTVDFASYYIKCKALPTSIDIRASFYYTICGVIGCFVQFTCMVSASNEFQEQDLSRFLNCVRERYESFKKSVEDFKKEHEERLQYKEIKELYRLHTDTLKFMTLLLGAVNRGSNMTPAEVKDLQSKKVMLLISDLTLSSADVTTLNSIYNESFKSENYEIIWVPVADVVDDKLFKIRRSQMPWYSCNSVVRDAAAMFIRKCWHFNQRTKVVVLNENGEVENADAMSMMHLWGWKAFPFTPKRNDELWEEHSDNWLKFVVNDDICQHIEKSFQMKELMFLCGSAEDSNTVKEIRGILSSETYTSFNIKFFEITTNAKRKQFLYRLENCICWKMPANKEKPDSRMLKLIELYNSYEKQSGLAIFTRGPSLIVNTSLPDILKVLSEHESWISQCTTQNFHEHFLDYYRKFRRCYEFYITNMVGDIPQWTKCPIDDCPRNMENVVTFKCCHGLH